MAKRANTRCLRCGEADGNIGALSGLCTRCRNADVADLERQLGIKPGDLGREPASGRRINSRKTGD